jgi:hypothetical protein
MSDYDTEVILTRRGNCVVEIMFHARNQDWFVSLFPLVDVDFNKMKNYYIGKDFYEVKKNYKGKIFTEGDFV